MPLTLAFIALGGAAGSVARYVLSAALQRSGASDFPAGTLVVNVVGSVILGFLMRYLLEGSSVSADARALLTTGFCGGFTTFATFSYETMALVERGDLRRAVLYVGLSIVLSLGGIVAGAGVARQWIAHQRAGTSVRP